jgi:hypothetical protein
MNGGSEMCLQILTLRYCLLRVIRNSVVFNFAVLLHFISFYSGLCCERIAYILMMGNTNFDTQLSVILCEKKGFFSLITPQIGLLIIIFYSTCILTISLCSFFCRDVVYTFDYTTYFWLAKPKVFIFWPVYKKLADFCCRGLGDIL